MAPSQGSPPLRRLGVGEGEAGGGSLKVKAVAERNELNADRAGGPTCSTDVCPVPSRASPGGGLPDCRCLSSSPSALDLGAAGSI